MARQRRKKRKADFLIRRFPRIMQKKLVLLFLTIILAFIVVIIRIVQIDISAGAAYTKIVLEQQQYNNRVIPYKRGDIVDRSGTKLATSERVYNVILDAYVLSEYKYCVDLTARTVAECFAIPEEKVRSVLEENPAGRYNVLTSRVSYETAQHFLEEENRIQEEARKKEQEAGGSEGEEKNEIPVVKGIWLEEDYQRLYPYGSLASDVLGFSVEGNVGAMGIESAYNAILNGTDGREYGYFADETSIERTVKAAKDGCTVVSTLDLTLQSIVEQCIREFNEAHAGEEREGEPGSKNTAVIIMVPNTGEILAEASYPNFDLNNPRDLSHLYSAEKWNTMTEEEQLDAMNQLWRNFCVSDAFEPGSTAKPFTVAAGLETGVLTGEETYVCDGYRHVGDNDIYCHLRSGHGTETVADAVADSCNVALMDMAAAIGVENFTRYQHIFGFGEYTGIDLPGEASTEALLYSAEEMQPVDLATCSFGQSFNVTMTQMASAFCSLINGGYYYEPHVVKRIEDGNGRVIETKDPVLIRKTISAETSDKIKTYLKAVMEYGTGTSAAVPGYDIGGKTGTAEKIPRNTGKHILSYIGYAPQENPEVLVYVVIDEPNVENQTISQYVLDLAKRIMENAFPQLAVTQMEQTAAEAGTDDPGTDMPQDTYQENPEDYTNYDTAYEDMYQNEDGSYIDESYVPDLDDWAAGPVQE